MSNNSGALRVADQPTDYEYVIPGAILMDGLFHSFCLGFVLALGLKYWEEYAEDSFRKRAFVMTIVLLSTLQTILEDYKVWTLAVLRRPWAGSPFLWVEFFLTGAICSMCEAFYIRRCWKMTDKNPWALYPMVLLWISIVAAQFYITITLGLEFQYLRVSSVSHVQDERLGLLLRETLIVFSYWVAGCSILDMTVAAILITCLLKSKTGLGTSNSVVHRIVFLTLETALFPSISMVVASIILHGAPNPGQNDDVVLFFVYLTAKLYAIGLLRTLNARARLRQRIDSTDLGRTSLAKWSWDQDHEKQENAGKPDRTSQVPTEAATTLRGSVESSAPIFNSHCEGIPPEQIPEGPPTGSHRVHFGSPLLDQYERGSYARLRVSSIHRMKPQSDEQHP
ncbi:hypothetical protein DFH09DRAFT_79036 [Mycena vulgaris]|nr:hypothetical protein DFH09DRAFT_79036 [Mycena vulgaris]